MGGLGPTTRLCVQKTYLIKIVCLKFFLLLNNSITIFEYELPLVFTLDGGIRTSRGIFQIIISTENV